MDSRTRRLEQQWKSGGGVDCHAALLSCLLRLGHFTKNELLLCAYVGHEAARIVCAHEVRPDGIIAYGKYIKNLEISDFIDGLNNWGIKAKQVATVGILNCLPLNEAGETVLENISRFVYTGKNKDRLAEPYTNWPEEIEQWWSSVRVKAARIMDFTRMDMAQGASGLDSARRAIAILPDGKILEGIQLEITRWILDEYA